jgi:hypothetical protein
LTTFYLKGDKLLLEEGEKKMQAARKALKIGKESILLNFLRGGPPWNSWIFVVMGYFKV